MTKFRTPTQTEPIQLGIWDVPPKVRSHGLTEAHVYPLVSNGRKVGGTLVDVHRRPTFEAWHDWPSVEITRSANAIAAIGFDCDGHQGYERAMDWFQDHPEHWFNWAVTRLATGGTHFVLTLARPVLTGDDAKEKPRLALARVTEYLRQQLGGDPDYRGGLSHNPMSYAQGGRYRTTWGRREPYPLAELLAIVPKGYRRPKAPTTDASRNYAMFLALKKWAGSPANLHIPVIDQALVWYEQMPAEDRLQPHPYTLAEVRASARQVEKLRRDWIVRGQFGPVGDRERSEWGRRRQAIGVKNRRKNNRRRDGAIVDDVLRGATLTATATKYGLTTRRIGQILERDVPLMKRPRRGRPMARGDDVSERTKRRRRARIAAMRDRWSNAGRSKSEVN